MYYFHSRRIHYVEMSILPKLINKFNDIPKQTKPVGKLQG